MRATWVKLNTMSAKLFAERVMPKLKGLFSEWEDKWWPAPMAESERACYSSPSI